MTDDSEHPSGAGRENNIIFLHAETDCDLSFEVKFVKAAPGTGKQAILARYFELQARRKLVESVAVVDEAFAQSPKGLLLDAFLPPEDAGERLYSILGRYPYWVAKHGTRKARFIFASQSLLCVLSFWFDWLMRRFRALRAAGGS